MKTRANEPIPPEGDITTPPAWLTADQKADWAFTVKNAPSGVIFACDRGVLEVYIVAADQHRIANEEQQKLDAGGGMRLLVTTTELLDKNGAKKGGGNIVISPYINIISMSGARMMRAAAELGFTPASRPRLQQQIYDPAMTPARPAPTNDGGVPRPRGQEPTGRDLDKLMAGREALN